MLFSIQAQNQTIITKKTQIHVLQGRQDTILSSHLQIEKLLYIINNQKNINEAKGRMDNIQINLSFINSGSTSNSKLQRHMVRLELQKLRLINAESELQIEMKVFQDESQNFTQKSVQIIKVQSTLQDQNLNQQLLIEKFSLLNLARKIELKQKFQQAKLSWEEYSISQFLSNPNYLFVEGNQPCYVFFQLINQKLKKISQSDVKRIQDYFPNSAVEVLFYVLLCLNDSKKLSKRLLQMVLQKSSLISGLIRLRMNQSFEMYKDNIQKERLKYTLEKPKEQDIIDKDHQQKKVKKVKKITKISKQPKNKHSVKKVQGDQTLYEQIQTENKEEKIINKETNKGLEKIISKLVGFTMSSYVYVINQEIKLRTKLESLQSSIEPQEINAAQSNYSSQSQGKKDQL